MVLRVYVEKKDGFDVEAKALERELREILGISALQGLRLINRYDVEGISDGLFEQCVPTVYPTVSHPGSTASSMTAL